MERTSREPSTRDSTNYFGDIPRRNRTDSCRCYWMPYMPETINQFVRHIIDEVVPRVIGNASKHRMC